MPPKMKKTLFKGQNPFLRIEISDSGVRILERRLLFGYKCLRSTALSNISKWSAGKKGFTYQAYDGYSDVYLCSEERAREIALCLQHCAMHVRKTMKRPSLVENPFSADLLNGDWINPLAEIDANGDCRVPVDVPAGRRRSSFMFWKKTLSAPDNTGGDAVAASNSSLVQAAKSPPGSP